VGPKRQKRNQDPQQFKIPLVVNRFVMPLETFPDATEEDGNKIIACGAVKEKPRKHKVLLLGDSQVRGCVDLLNQNLNREFGVSGFVKPGAKTSSILDTNIDKDMSKDDVIIVCAGTNDISKTLQRKDLET
jgi:lysophospholipase L1-like esterase